MVVSNSFQNGNIFFIFRENGQEVIVRVVDLKIECKQKLNLSETKYFNELISKIKTSKIKV